MPNTYKINTEKLIALRKAKHYSQEKMGELLATDRSNYGKIERGETELAFRVAYKLTEVLGARFEDFINFPTTNNIPEPDETALSAEGILHIY